MDELNPIYLAAVDAIARTGAKNYEIRWCEEQEPTVWFAISTHISEGEERQSVYAGFHPIEATIGLAEKLIDGSICAHCLKMTIFEPDWTAPRLGEFRIGGMDVLHCTYQYDPELKKFRRSCEGEE
jgi:hypothetical protein